MTKHFQPLACYASICELFEFGMQGGLDDRYTIPRGAWHGLRLAMQDAKCFDFEFADWMPGAADNCKVLAQFTADCVTEGVFQPPFDVTLLQWPDAPFKAGADPDRPSYGTPPETPPKQLAAALILTLLRNDDPVTAMGWLPLEGGKGTAAMIFGFAIVKDGERLSVLQDMSVLSSHKSGLTMQCSEKYVWPREHAVTYSILRPEWWEPKAGRNVQQLAEHDGSVTIRNVLYYMGALSSRGPKERKAVPRPEIVARREREHKAPWVSYSVVTLPGPSEAQPGASRGPLAATRTSPRIHWRRGHPRHLASGRVVPIPPMLVGVSELGEVIASYHMK